VVRGRSPDHAGEVLRIHAPDFERLLVSSRSWRNVEHDSLRFGQHDLGTTLYSLSRSQKVLETPMPSHESECRLHFEISLFGVFE